MKHKLYIRLLVTGHSVARRKFYIDYITFPIHIIKAAFHNWMTASIYALNSIVLVFFPDCDDLIYFWLTSLCCTITS